MKYFLWYFGHFPLGYIPNSFEHGEIIDVFVYRCMSIER